MDADKIDYGIGNDKYDKARFDSMRLRPLNYGVPRSFLAANSDWCCVKCTFKSGVHSDWCEKGKS